MSSHIEIRVRKTGSWTVTFVAINGPYSKTDETSGQLFGWIGQKGYISAGPQSGMYLNVLEQVPADELLQELDAE
ncbi:hypothetical protein ACFLST_01350 [Chloroflexota bacterium]